MRQQVDVSPAAVAEIKALRRGPIARLSISIDSELVDWVKAVAAQADVPVSTVIEWAVRKYMEARDEAA